MQAAVCLHLHQVQLGQGGEEGLQEMLGWPTGVGEDRFFSCILLSNVEASPNLALMSLLTLAQLNTMISRDKSVCSVLCEVTPELLPTEVTRELSTRELYTKVARELSKELSATTEIPREYLGEKQRRTLTRETGP